MKLWQSVPFACILLPLFGAAVCSVLPRRAARAWAMGLIAAVAGLSCFFLAKMTAFDAAYPYRMGHYDAPLGNMLRAGPLEAVLGVLFSLLTLVCALGGGSRIREDLTEGRQGLYHTLLLLMTAALMAQVYTDDLFTAYVFVEIMTIAGCGLIAVRSGPGRSLVAAVRYMIMNLIGSALFLLGIILLYDLTGHLLMSSIHEALQAQAGTGSFDIPLTVVVGLLCAGLAAKSALFPFHAWVPDAYATATPASAALLASLVSKSYIVVLLKVLFRVIGPAYIEASGVDNILFLFGIIGMLAGSVVAIRVPDVKRMVAWSSVAQIGYIYMALGLMTGAGAAAAVFHIIAHAAAKSVLFLSVDKLCEASEGHEFIGKLRGAGYRSPLAGAAFTVGALSLVGIPLLGGFTTKLNLARAVLDLGGAHAWAGLICLTLSTLLNVLYMLRTVLVLWSHPDRAPEAPQSSRAGGALAVSLGALMAANFLIFFFAQPLMDAINRGFALFS